MVACAIDYLRQHVLDTVHIRDLARLTGVSERGLRSAFHRICGVSPKQYQIRERLNEVHRELCVADARPRHVTDIATENGFFELGRFAGLYKRQYGETPSETLRHAHALNEPESRRIVA